MGAAEPLPKDHDHVNVGQSVPFRIMDSARLRPTTMRALRKSCSEQGQARLRMPGLLPADGCSNPRLKQRLEFPVSD